jgi:hypothetical protein
LIWLFGDCISRDSFEGNGEVEEKKKEEKKRKGAASPRSGRILPRKLVT